MLHDALPLLLVLQASQSLVNYLGLILTALGLGMTLILFLVGAIMRQGGRNTARIEVSVERLSGSVNLFGQNLARVEGAVGALTSSTTSIATTVGQMQQDTIKALREDLRAARTP